MLLNSKSTLKKGLAIIATVASIFASLAVGVNNAAQVLQRIEFPSSLKPCRLLEPESQSSQQPHSSEDF